MECYPQVKKLIVSYVDNVNTTEVDKNRLFRNIEKLLNQLKSRKISTRKNKSRRLNHEDLDYESPSSEDTDIPIRRKQPIRTFQPVRSRDFADFPTVQRKYSNKIRRKEQKEDVTEYNPIRHDVTSKIVYLQGRIPLSTMWEHCLKIIEEQKISLAIFDPSYYQSNEWYEKLCEFVSEITQKSEKIACVIFFNKQMCREMINTLELQSLRRVVFAKIFKYREAESDDEEESYMRPSKSEEHFLIATSAAVKMKPVDTLIYECNSRLRHTRFNQQISSSCAGFVEADSSHTKSGAYMAIILDAINASCNESFKNLVVAEIFCLSAFTVSKVRKELSASKIVLVDQIPCELVKQFVLARIEEDGEEEEPDLKRSTNLFLSSHPYSIKVESFINVYHNRINSWLTGDLWTFLDSELPKEEAFDPNQITNLPLLLSTYHTYTSRIFQLEISFLIRLEKILNLVLVNLDTDLSGSLLDEMVVRIMALFPSGRKSLPKYFIERAVVLKKISCLLCSFGAFEFNRIIILRIPTEDVCRFLKFLVFCKQHEDSTDNRDLLQRLFEKKVFSRMISKV